MSLLSTDNHSKITKGKYYQTIPPSNNQDIATLQYDIITIDYQETFKSNFDELSENYDLINPKKIYEFIKLNNDLLNALYQILPLLKKYFPSEKFLLKFVPDYEFEELNQLVIYICTNEDNFDNNWNLLNKLNDEIDELKLNIFVSNLIAVDLW